MHKNNNKGSEYFDATPAERIMLCKIGDIINLMNSEVEEEINSVLLCKLCES